MRLTLARAEALTEAAIRRGDVEGAIKAHKHESNMREKSEHCATIRCRMELASMFRDRSRRAMHRSEAD